NGLTIPREAAQERKHTRILLLARKVEDEEDRTCGLVRPVCSADVALHHAEEFRGDLIPVLERPLHRLARQIVAGAHKGLDRSLKVHRNPSSLGTGQCSELWLVEACSSDRDAWSGCQHGSGGGRQSIP